MRIRNVQRTTSRSFYRCVSKCHHHIGTLLQLVALCQRRKVANIHGSYVGVVPIGSIPEKTMKLSAYSPAGRSFSFRK